MNLSLQSGSLVAALLVVVTLFVCAPIQAQQDIAQPSPGPNVQPPNGKSRLYFFPGPHMTNSFDVILNDVDIGTVRHGEFTFIDVPPGRYIAERRFNTIGGGLGDPAILKLDLVEGQSLYIASTRYTPPIGTGGALGFLFSTIAGATASHEAGDFFEIQPNGDGTADQTFVSPNPNSVARLNSASPPKSD
jgi:hypothetical protein